MDRDWVGMVEKFAWQERMESSLCGYLCPIMRGKKAEKDLLMKYVHKDATAFGWIKTWVWDSVVDFDIRIRR